MNKFFRKNIELMEGYAPGEQPRTTDLIKLNTNENPYPPSPKVFPALKEFKAEFLRLYPDPDSNNLRKVIADNFNLKDNNIITGNGSDDILTIIIRSFAGENDNIVCFEPAYSLYPVLAQIQNADTVKIKLTKSFNIPKCFFSKELPELCSNTRNKIFFIARPNSPTGNSFPLEQIKQICSRFKGIVVIDEAYADFADDSCIKLASEFKNVIIIRTLSKAYSLAGIRLGWAIADPLLVTGMTKVKDSYNVNTITQSLAVAAISDQQYLKKNIEKIITTRNSLSARLVETGFEVIPSQANFIFTSPPDRDGKNLFLFLKSHNILVRYFDHPGIEQFIRITIGKEEDINKLIDLCKNYTQKL